MSFSETSWPMSVCVGVQPHELDRFGRTHHGLISFDHAAGFGMSRTDWNRLVSDERRFEVLYPDVVRVLGAPVSIEQRIAAAVLAAGPGARASHRSAAHVWGASRPGGDPIDVMLVGRTRRARLEGVVIHRPRNLDDLAPSVRQGIPTTNPLRTLTDLGSVDPPGVYDALHHFVMRGWVNTASVAAVLDRHSGRGYRGATALRNALDQWLVDGKPADSELEIRMRKIRDDHGLPSMTFHADVLGFEVDFLVDGTNIVVECDGWSTHGADRTVFLSDRDKDTYLMSKGYVVHRVTRSMLLFRPRLVAERIAGVLWSFAPETARRHATAHPTSVLGAAQPDRTSSPSGRGAQDVA
jgi:very-short-patch-repair endonuclease